MSIQDIIVKILADAEQELATILQEAQNDAKKEEKTILESWKVKCDALESLTDEKIDRAIKKSEALANMEGKRRVLEKKQEILESILSEVVKQLASIPAKDYENLLVSLLNQIDIDSGVLYPAQGKENSTKGAIKIAKKQFSLGESRDFLGGFIIESETSDYDFTFEALVLKNLRKELELKIMQSFHTS